MYDLVRMDLNPLFRSVELLVKEYESRMYPSGVYNRMHRFPLHFSGMLTYAGVDGGGDGEIVNANRPLRCIDIIDSNGIVIATKEQIENEFVSLVPTMCVLPATVFNYYVDIYQRDLSTKASMYYRDDLNINRTQLISVDSGDTTMSVLELFYKNTPHKVLVTIDNLYREILDTVVTDFMLKDTESLYTTNSDGVYTIISRNDIYKIRYQYMCRDGKKDILPKTTGMHEALVNRQTAKPPATRQFYNTEEFIPAVLDNMDAILHFTDNPYLLRFNGRVFSLIYVPIKLNSKDYKERKKERVYEVFDYIRNYIHTRNGEKHELAGITVLE